MIVLHGLLGYFLVPKAIVVMSNIPVLSVNILLTSVLAPLLTIIYLMLRLDHSPNIYFDKIVIMVSTASIVVLWFIALFEILIIGPSNIFVKQLLSSYVSYVNINIIWFILLAPILEEILFRGYFYDLLRQYGELIAIVLSSLLFVIPHVLFAGISIDIVVIIQAVIIFMRSMVLSISYRYGGLVASVLAHIFINAYSLFLNSGQS